MARLTFETEPSERSCGYCQFHGGFLRKGNISNRHCIGKHCKWLILFTQHEDYGSFHLWEEDCYQRYRGSPFRFLELYGKLIAKPQAKDEDDEPPDGEYEVRDYKADAKQAWLRKVRNGTARKTKSRKQIYREKRNERKKRNDLADLP